MTELFPNYYHRFRCIAEKCRHNCCIGWEIDVDDETYSLYGQLLGAVGERLRGNITVTDGVPHFVLGKDGRCPMLNEQNRCDVIETFGEAALCQICDDHPRFCRDYGDRTETGLGMACEAAADLILRCREPFYTVDETGTPTSPADVFFALRATVIDRLQDQKTSLDTALAEVIALCGARETPRDRSAEVDRFLALERLDETWTERLLALREFGGDLPTDLPEEQALRNFAVYLCYRHLDPEDLPRTAGLVVRCFGLVRDLCALCLVRTGALRVTDIVEITRMFSAEIEYSDENVDRLEKNY